MGRYLIAFGIFLGSIYFMMFFLSIQGWGYAGYSRSTSYHPSVWYFGGSSFYPEKNVRSGSIGSKGSLGGGGGFGK